MPGDTPSHTPTPPLPAIESPLAPDAVMGALQALSERGKLAGFERLGDRAFSCDAFGSPFDRSLVGTLEPAASGGGGDSGGGTRITLVSRLKPKLPAVFAAVLASTVWPGVWLTDRMLNLYFSWYDFATWMWYLPLTILPLPWAWVKMMRRSNGAAHASALETIEKLSKAVSGRVEGA
ncbi:MAG: hypothetical protein RBS39_00400 [Phycisphaerales bacterium]|jgi:hypothetical protein|nr:hypothetical protein [Phycisphaerales bacterium]